MNCSINSCIDKAFGWAHDPVKKLLKKSDQSGKSIDQKMDNALKNFKDGMESTFLIVGEGKCKVYIPFVPGLIRVADAVMHIAKNIIKLVVFDGVHGIVQALLFEPKYISNIPIRLLTLVRNAFYLTAATFQVVPVFGGFAAQVVAKAHMGMEKILELVPCKGYIYAAQNEARREESILLKPYNSVSYCDAQEADCFSLS